MVIKDNEILGAGGRGTADVGVIGGDPAPQGFIPESYYDWSGQTDTTTTMKAMLHGISWGDGGYSVGEGGRKVICIACDGTQTRESPTDWTSSPTTDVLMTVTGLKPAYAYIVRGYAQNNRSFTYYSPFAHVAWMTDATSATMDLLYNISASVTGVWKDKVEITAKGNIGNTLAASCKIYYADVTDSNAPALTFLSTDAKNVADTGAQVFIITGLTPGHDYIFSLQKTADGNTICDRPNWVRLPSLTTDTATQKVTDTGWQTVYEELMYGNQRRNVITATRLNNTVTLDVSEQFRHVAFPTRYSGMDFNITGEGIYSKVFTTATTLKSSSIFQSGSQESWLTLGSFAANDILNTPLTVTRPTLTKTVESAHTVIPMTIGYQDYTSNYSSDFWTAGQHGRTSLYVPIPEAGTPEGVEIITASSTPTGTGSTNVLALTGTSWGANCTGGKYTARYRSPSGESNSVEVSDSGSLAPHELTFTSTVTNTVYSVMGVLENDAGLVSQSAPQPGEEASGLVSIFTPAAPPNVSLTLSDGTTASFAFSSASSESVLPETYYWRLGNTGAWHPSSESATGLTPGQSYTVQVKTVTNPADMNWGSVSGSELPYTADCYGGGDSLVVNGLTFVAGGGTEPSQPGIWAKHGLSNEKIGHLFVNVNGQKKRLSKVYAKVGNENQLIFRDYFGAYDTVDSPTIIQFVAHEDYKTATINIVQSVDKGTVVDWGDGSEKELPSGAETTITLTHTYINDGSYDVTLTPLKSSMLEILTTAGGYIGLRIE